MKFHLNYTPEKSSYQISHKSSVFLVGSCFAENIGQFLKEFKFRSHLNPNGILFNPLSIAKCLESCIYNTPIEENFILERDGLFYSYLHHSSFSRNIKKDLVQSINTETNTANAFLKTANVLIITFGTAFIYHHKQLDQTVANCHKQPLAHFTKRMLEVDEITGFFSKIIGGLKAFNPGLKILFTVSPVKYLRDGVEENNLSKSTLLLSIHKLTAQHQNCFYFPAFELVNDDLRDYRFYKDDLAHPNQTAINYVWQKFSECYFSPETQAINKEISKLNQALNHRQIKENVSENVKWKEYITRQRTEIKKMDSSIEI